MSKEIDNAIECLALARSNLTGLAKAANREDRLNAAALWLTQARHALERFNVKHQRKGRK